MATDGSGMPDGVETLRTMGWMSLPYGAAGLVRKADAGGSRTVWSWLVVLPWSDDSKPWIDGTELMTNPMVSEAEQREMVLTKMRSILDDRYGDTVGNAVADRLLEELLGDD